ncbi:MAG: hypothetical protein FJ272_19120, partial [Planctomycetes bacterium]|nr:hypothetical protein [Planctomycetota bacterium]
MPSDNRFRETLALLFSLLLSTTVLPAADKDSDGDGLSDELEQELALLPAVKQELRPVCASKDEKYTDEQAKVNAPDILSLDACH